MLAKPYYLLRQLPVKKVSHELIRRIMRELGYSLLTNRKTKEGEDHPDRDAQFEFITVQNASSPHGTGSFYYIPSKFKCVVPAHALGEPKFFM
jgi:hypothetical protein